MKKHGIALILVVSILTVVAITVVSFIFTMRMEARAAANFLWQEKARYIAEAGVVHARAILEEDKQNNLMDTYGDVWRSAFDGSAVDNNGDGQGDSRWIEVTDAAGAVIGRYAVLVEDESAKININTAGYHNESPLKVTQGAGPFEVSLKDFFLAHNVSAAEGKAQAIIEYRWGKDNTPGTKGIDDNNNAGFLSADGIDDNADGESDEDGEGSDEPQEFCSTRPYGDDRPFLTAEQVKTAAEISESVYEQIGPDITAYSRVRSVNKNGDLQKNLNYITAEELIEVLFLAGVSDPWQKAVNLVDFGDADFSRSVLVKSVKRLGTVNQGPLGDWEWAADHYENKTPGGASGVWNWLGVPVGTYYVVLEGTTSGRKVGDVTINGMSDRHVNSGDAFAMPVTIVEEEHPFFPEGGRGRLEIIIKNNEEEGAVCYFKSVELVSAEGKMLDETKEICGAEGIRVNEVMVRPEIELAVSVAQSPGGDWIWQNGYYLNAQSGRGELGEGAWIWEDIPDGEYYLTVYGSDEGQVVGDVQAGGTVDAGMHSGERFADGETITVNGGRLRLDISNNSTENCYFQSIILSQQPDAEYIELVNLTAAEVALDGWSLDAAGSDGWPANIPLNTVIPAGGYLVLAVDKEDDCSGIAQNGLSFSSVWGSLPSAQLDFVRSVAGYSDMFSDTPSGGAGEIILRDERGNIVDRQRYSSGQAQPYLSLEKGDPACAGESLWYNSEALSGATPAAKNNNAGMRQTVGEETVEYDISGIKFRNRPLANLGEAADVPSGQAWQTILIEELMGIADDCTVCGLPLSAEGHRQSGGWGEELRAVPPRGWFVSESAEEEGVWLWDEGDNIPNGVYTVSLYGQQAEAVAVSFHLADDTWTAWTPPLTPGGNNGVPLGRIEIGTGAPGALPARKIEMRLKNVSAGGIAHFDYLYLAPLPFVEGKININTASEQVLQALPMIDRDTAARIINSRPLGNMEGKARGIGDLLHNDILDDDPQEKAAKFGAVSNLVTVRSDVFQIIVTAEALHNGRAAAAKRIRAVIER